MKKILTHPVFFGFLSGAVVVIVVSMLFDLTFSPIPGALYGIVTGVFMVQLHTSNMKFVRFISWVLVSALSYFLSMKVMVIVSSPLNYSQDFWIGNSVFAGMLGASILSMGFIAIFSVKISLMRFLLTLIGGGFIVVVVLVWMGGGRLSEEIMLILFLAWQTVVTGILVPTHGNKKKLAML